MSNASSRFVESLLGINRSLKEDDLLPLDRGLLYLLGGVFKGVVCGDPCDNERGGEVDRCM
jgi:hypothetical protein